MPHGGMPALLLAALLTLSSGASALPVDLTFVPDKGIRISSASIPNIGYDSATKTFYLFYNGEGPKHGPRLATSSDGLNFTDQGQQTSFAFDPRRVLLPDGTYRQYSFDNSKGFFQSRVSTDGTNFTLESGSRYSLDASDNGTAGISDIFAIPDGRVIMLYLGDLRGLNNLRRSISSDNGQSFAFDRGDILGDSTFGGGARSYVDTRSFLIKGGCRRLFSMREAKAIYSHTSSDYGFTFKADRGTRLKVTDFEDQQLMGLFDPAVIRLPDGRYRMYVASTGKIDGQSAPVIVSATTKRPTKKRKQTRCVPEGSGSTAE